MRITSKLPKPETGAVDHLVVAREVDTGEIAVEVHRLGDEAAGAVLALTVQAGDAGLPRVVVHDANGTWVGDLQLRPDGLVERVAGNYDRADVALSDAKLFMVELLDSVESLTAVAEAHGERTLADLFYLHSAIAEGGFIDAYPRESDVLEIVESLPSAEKWKAFIKVEYMAQSHCG